MATGANTTVYFVKETTAGVTPATPAWKALAYGSTSLKREQPTFSSELIRGDRMSAPSSNGVPKVAGSISTELIFGDQDDLIAGVFGRADWTANKVTVGKVNQTFSILEKMDGVAGKKWRLYRGCIVNSLSCEINTEGNIKAEYAFLGVAASMLEVAPTGSTFGQPSGNLPMKGIIGAVKIDNALNNLITSITLNLDNGADIRPVVGSMESRPIEMRTMKATGEMTMYYETSSLAEKAQTEDRMAMEYIFSDGADANTGNRYKITATKVKPSDAWPQVGGADEDIMLTVPMTYEPDNATGTHITIERIAKAVAP